MHRYFAIDKDVVNLRQRETNDGNPVGTASRAADAVPTSQGDADATVEDLIVIAIRASEHLNMHVLFVLPASGTPYQGMHT